MQCPLVTFSSSHGTKLADERSNVQRQNPRVDGRGHISYRLDVSFSALLWFESEISRTTPLFCRGILGRDHDVGVDSES
jgi:hypothetical protein